MINEMYAYQKNGYKCGLAMRCADAGLVSHYRNWLTRALSLENSADRPLARRVFDAAYRDAATPERRPFC